MDITQRVISLDRLMKQLKLAKTDSAEWQRTFKGRLITLKATDGTDTPLDGTWWLVVVGLKSDTALEYSGTLGGCLMYYVATMQAIASGLHR